MPTTIKAFSLNIDGKASTVYLLSTPHPHDPSKKLVLPMSYIPKPEQTQSKHINFVLDVSGSMKKYDDAGSDTQPPSRLFLALQTIKTIIAQQSDDTVFSLIPFDDKVHSWGFRTQEAANIDLDNLFKNNPYGGKTAIYDALAQLTPYNTIDNGHSSTILITDGADRGRRGGSKKSMQEAIIELKKNFAGKLPAFIVVGISNDCDKTKLHTIAKLSNTEEIYVKTANELTDPVVLGKISQQLAYGQHVMFNLANHPAPTSQIIPYEQLTPSEAYCVDATTADSAIVGNILGATAIEETDATSINTLEELENNEAQAIIYAAWLRDEAQRIYEAPMREFSAHEQKEQHHEFVNRLHRLKQLEMTFQTVKVAPFGKESLHTYRAVLQDKVLNDFRIRLYSFLEGKSEVIDEKQYLRKDGRDKIVSENKKDSVIAKIEDLYSDIFSELSVIGITEEQLNNVTQTIIANIRNNKPVFIPTGFEGNTISRSNKARDFSTVQVSNQTLLTGIQYFSEQTNTRLAQHAHTSSLGYRTNSQQAITTTASLGNSCSSSSVTAPAKHENAQTLHPATTSSIRSSSTHFAQPVKKNPLEEQQVAKLVELSCDLTKYLEDYKSRNTGFFSAISSFFVTDATTPAINAFINLLTGCASEQLRPEQLAVLQQGQLGAGLTQRLRSTKYDVCWPATLPREQRTLADLTNLFVQFHQQGPESLHYAHNQP